MRVIITILDNKISETLNSHYFCKDLINFLGIEDFG